MSISPHSNTRVALLWGDRWWIEGRNEPVVFGEFSRAAETLLAEFGDARPARLRLVYQPTFLASTAVNCPQGGRSTLREALQEEYPSLGDDALAWSYEPLASAPQTGTTLLHYETQPGLYALIASLHAAGIVIEGAWPLATVLNLVPADWPDTGALTVVAVAEKQTLIFRHTPMGVRETEQALGAGAAALASEVARQTSERTDTALYVVGLDSTGDHLATALCEIDEPGGKRIGWNELVRAAHTLSPRQPNQMLPATSRLTPSRLVQGATAAVLMAVCALAAEQGLHLRARQRTMAERTVEIAALRQDVVTLRGTDVEANRLRAEIARLQPGPVSCGALLRALPRSLPLEIVLTRVRADRRGFTVEGGVAAPGLTPAHWHTWQAGLQADPNPWRLAEPRSPVPATAFALKGQWR
ncbi:MAG: hypothetical protein Q8N18_07055 [Opitutaceae bacterium]|nr:hypothetical protein [Opitutaceae bacterium]